MSKADTDQSSVAVADEAQPPPGHEASQTTQRTARAASITGLRQGLSMGLAAVTAAIVARVLGATNYGYYAGAMAAFQLALAFSELGFGIVLTREMAQRPGERGNLMRSGVHVQLAWSLVVAAALAGLGLATGARPRGEVMLVMATAVVASGLSPVRQVFLVTFNLGRLFVADVLSSALQASAMITLALLRYGIVAIAGASAAGIWVNQLWGAWLGRNLVDRAPATSAQRRRITRIGIPLGAASLIASLYFTVDVVILTWLVAPIDLGHYAAAVKLLTVVVTIPGFIMQAGIPALAKSVEDREELSAVSGRLAHWIAVTALPLCVGLTVFAKTAIDVAFGHAFLAAVPLLRILMLAGILSLVSNLCGILLSTLSIVRPQLIFNVLVLCVNVAGNIVLVPRYGVAASAWLTVGCELIIVGYGVVALRHRVHFSRVASPSLRAVAAIAAAGALGLALSAHPAIGIPASGAVFAGLIFTLGAWPPDLVPARFRSG